MGDLSDYDIPVEGYETLPNTDNTNTDYEENSDNQVSEEKSDVIKFIEREIRENLSPYFDEGEIQAYLDKNKGDVNATIYELLIIKAEDSSINLSGLMTADTSNYFRRLASRYKTFNTGNLIGG